MFEKEVKKILKKSLKIRKLKQEKLTNKDVFIQYDSAFDMFSMSFYENGICREGISIDLDKGGYHDKSKKAVERSMEMLDNIIHEAELKKQESAVCQDV